MRPVWKYSAEARRQHQQRKDGHSARDAVLTAAHQGKLGVCFSGASFGAAYQLGAAQILHDLGLLDAHTPIAGASAGGIVAVATRCSLQPMDVLKALDDIVQDLLRHGEKKRLSGVLRHKLEQVLPPNAHQLCSSSSSSTSTMQDSGGGSAGSSNGQHTQPKYHITPPQQHHSSTAGGAQATAIDSGGQRKGQPAAAAPAGSSIGSSSGGGTGPSPMGPASRAGCSTAGQPACVLVGTRVRPLHCPGCLQPDVFAGGFSSNEELLDALLTGAHMPGVSDGSCWTHFRGHRYIDGGIRDSCPPIPGVEHTLIVYPVPNTLLTRPWPYRLVMKPPLQYAVTISPGQYNRGWPYTRSYKESNELVMHPKSVGVLHMLFERGRRDALAWAQMLGLTADHVRALRAARQPRGAAPAAGGKGAAAELGWLSTSPDHLRMLVPVPQELMHFLHGG